MGGKIKRGSLIFKPGDNQARLALLEWRISTGVTAFAIFAAEAGERVNKQIRL